MRVAIASLLHRTEDCKTFTQKAVKVLTDIAPK